MKVKHKVIISSVLRATLLLGITILVFYSTFDMYTNFETKNIMEKDFETVEQIIENEKQAITHPLRDWAYWDDTYSFIQNGNQEYVTSNLEEAALEPLRLCMVVIVNQNEEIVGYKDNGLTQETAKEFVDKLKQVHFYTKSLTVEEDANTKMVLLKDQTYLVGAALVNNSAHTAVSHGTIIFVQPFSEENFNYIKTVTGLEVTLEEPKGNSAASGLEILHTESDGKSYLTASRLMENDQGEESINVTISKEETNFGFVKDLTNRFIIICICVTAFIMLIDYYVINQYFLKRIKKLIDFTSEVAQKKDLTMLIDLDGDDELNVLANTTNYMLNVIDSAQRNIGLMDERHRLTMEATNDGYLDLMVKELEIYISPGWKQLFGCKEEDNHLLLGEYLSKVVDDSKEKLEAWLFGMNEVNFEHSEMECQMLSPQHGIIWVSHRGKVVQRDEDNKAIRFVCTFLDITQRKKREEEIIFLNFSDPLTLLKNRNYFNMELEVLKKEKLPNYFIIMCDVNGLELINDTFGHQEGDQVLIAVGNVLRRVCQPTDIIARWLGDEFGIIVKSRTKDEVYNLTNNISNEIGEIRDFHIEISVALGFAEGSYELKNPEEVLKLAEKRMFRNKLMNRDSSMNAVIRSLTRTLYEKNCETEEHTIRIKQLCNLLGNRLGLQKDQLDELELLALLHDIGKIGVSDKILEKTSKLTNDEWETMKTHTQIGYRITDSTRILQHIANKILSHHEKYDGTGYPKGLKGDEIPYLSRIINVVDSFDVMTHSRCYKKGYDFSYAISELRNCSGTQFDPNIVKTFLELLENE